MPRQWVANAPPLIFLGRVGQLWLLSEPGELAPLPERVLQAGLHIDPDVLAAIRHLAGESG